MASLIPTQEDLDKLKELLDSGDRGGFYLELYNQTGLKQALIQGAITTYSGVWGGMAVATNAMAKESNPDKYNLTLDEFSQQIAQATYDAAVLAHKEIRPLTEMDMMNADHSVWEDKGMGGYFPGNIQFAIDTLSLGGMHGGKTVSQGTLNSAKAGIQAVKEKYKPSIVLAHESGKRYDEFCDLDRYIKDDGSNDGILKVYDKVDGKYAFIQDMHPSPPYNILPGFNENNYRDNPSEREVLHRAELWNYTQANQPEDTRFIKGQDAPQILDEGLGILSRGHEYIHISDNCKVQGEFDSLSKAQDIVGEMLQTPNQDVNDNAREID